jgi:hypothetical protein
MAIALLVACALAVPVSTAGATESNTATRSLRAAARRTLAAPSVRATTAGKGRVRFSRYGAVPPIEPPSADQVTDGPQFCSTTIVGTADTSG